MDNPRRIFCFRSFLLIIGVIFLFDVNASELLYTSNPSKNSRNQLSPAESKELIDYIREIPKFSKNINPDHDISPNVACAYVVSLGDKIKSNLVDESSAGLCLGYLMMEEGTNKSSEASLERKDHLKRLQFKKSENLISLVKSGQYERAYHYFQIFYDDDVIKQKDSEGNSIYHILVQKCADPLAIDLFNELLMPSSL